MKLSFCVALAAITLSSNALSQGKPSEDDTRRVELVVTEDVAARPEPRPTPVTPGRPRTVAEEKKEVEVRTESNEKESGDDGALTFREIKSRIAEARRQLMTRPVTTASSGSTYEGIEIVRVAFFDNERRETDFVVMTKEAFLSTAEIKSVTSEAGRSLLIETIRGNGVNTPLKIRDSNGVEHLPLLVQYPRVERGKYIETAYYMSTHPGLVTPEVVNAGRIYVRNVVEAARDQLKRRGINIEPKIADIAERLAAVEHVDHFRFRNEDHSDIYDDIYTLFALNEGQTYRYAVSSAGAGGMVQMIPSTYRMVRAQFPQVPLIADFVDGMRNHTNAAQAMLLYMQWTWNDLKLRPAVTEALFNGTAKQEHLMAAGYNSNPARLPGYITRGGPAWASLIPRETQIYLQIYDSIERHVPMTPRAR